ncbi:glycosyltransferase [Macrococcus lamae]|uniref:Glycosyltransferase family 4 protein n=1 Tax=Macrococcus lamae TaxID=198484 RepID=A0A4R6BW28_9STAP|nr:glycosyltransferase [Macrococcus lamae]TDM12409.1 glycosyltransferase family 4 protein [Macrococcus lamae]
MKSYTFLVHNIYHIGGTTRSVINLANCLKAHGHDITLLSVFKSNHQPAYPVHNDIQIRNIIDYSNRYSFIPKIINRLRKYTPFFSPRLIQPDEPGINQFSAYIENRIVDEIKNVSTDFLVGTRATYNLLIAEYSTTATIGMEHMHFAAHPKRLQQAIIEEYVYLDYITTLTSIDRSCYRHYFDKEKVVLLPNIMSPVQVECKKSSIITALGRLEYEKGFDMLIEAAHMIKDELRTYGYQIMLYGDGTEKAELISQIYNLNIGDIIKINPSVNDISPVLSQSQITVIPSRSEGFGMVILEAFAFNNAVAGFNAPLGPKELLVHNENALIADCYNIKQLADYLLTLICNESLREKLIKGGKTTLSKYSPDQVYSMLKDQINN